MRTVRNLAIRGALLASTTALIALLAPEAALAQDTAAQADSAPEENIVVIGTRRTDRTVADSASPIDVISAADLSMQPTANLLDSVRNGAQTQIIVSAERRTADTSQRAPTAGRWRDATGGGAGALRRRD